MLPIGPNAAVSLPVGIPQEWVTECQGLQGWERDDFLRTLGEFGVQPEMVFPEPVNPLGDPPAGFDAWQVLEHPLTIACEQFAHRVRPLENLGEISIEAIELVSDAGHAIRLMDLRPVVGSRLGPRSPRDQEQLDRAFIRDAKILCDTGIAHHAVTDADNILYTTVNSKKLRTYWTTVETEEPMEPGVRQVARIVDCGNDAGLQRKLYNSYLVISD